MTAATQSGLEDRRRSTPKARTSSTRVRRVSDPDAVQTRDPEVETRALRGIPWTLLGYAASRGLSLIGTLVIARLLAPDEIGVVSTALVIITVLNLLSDNGLGLTIVTEDDFDDRLAGTILVAMVALGVALGAIVVAAAGPLAQVFDAPRLADILPILAVTVVFTTVSWFCLNVLQRALLFRARFIGQFAMSGGYVGVAVPAALAGAGVWSLVAGQLAGTLLSAVVLWSLLPYRVRPSFDRASARRAYDGSRAFLSQALTAFASGNSHYLAVSSLLGSSAMGLYTMSYRLTELPVQGIATPIAHATFPAFAQLKSESERRRASLLTSLRFTAFAALPPLCGLGALAPAFVEAILGSRWTGMVPVVPVLSTWAGLAVIAAVLAWFANAIGGAGWIARINIARLVVTVPALFLAAGFGSLVTVALVLLADSAVDVAVLARYAHRRLDVPWSGIWSALRSVLAAAAGLTLAALGTRLGLEAAGAGALVQLTAGTLAGTIAYLVLVRVLEPDLLQRGRELLKGATARG